MPGARLNDDPLHSFVERVRIKRRQCREPGRRRILIAIGPDVIGFQRRNRDRPAAPR